MKGDPFGSSYVCQKYIENPLLIGGGRKHDIRQWVAVTSVNPLKIWFFNECYVRLAANDYTLDNIQDRFTHLNNNAIISQHEKYDPDDEFWRCQWDMATYRKLLSERFGSDVWTSKVLPQMKHIVVTSMACVQEAWLSTESHQCSFQLFGYDFLVDANLRVWLLEVNNNPLMHASCPVTERLCDPCLRDLFRVLLDGEEAAPDSSSVRFDLLHCGPTIPDVYPDASFRDLFVAGRQISCPSVQPPQPETAVKVEDTKLIQQRLQARRVQELQEIADKKRQQQERQRLKAEKQERIKKVLRERIVGIVGSRHESSGGTNSTSLPSLGRKCDADLSPRRCLRQQCK
mmetsp:Transcript_103791/g.199261  ORF Transcript_103791/g.199261 Transcript_103791/m.199261 type:complete len:344 (+) Transcript_103791:3-1034(+)